MSCGIELIKAKIKRSGRKGAEVLVMYRKYSNVTSLGGRMTT